MFPSQQDIEDFRAQFGVESVLHRLALAHLNCCGTQAAVLITPARTKAETLALAWEMVRSAARWILSRSADLPMTERYMIIVGWSQSVREFQGQIFKTGGDHAAVRAIAESEDWKAFESALLRNWEKDVFDGRVV